ncbi:MAG TPA: anti-sigma factor [Hyphomicrobiales bacterium]|nr:anti-sigma factor [Hyphomicrobiales bacterium]
MSATGDPLGSDEGGQDLLAAEYVIGVLDAAGRRRAEARLATDEAFARAVEAWEARLAPLAGEVAPRVPPAAVWDRIAAALPPAAVAPRARAAKAGLWHSLPFWRTAGLGGAVVAAAALVALAVILPPPGAPPGLTATLMPKSGKAALMVTVDRGKDMLMVMPAALDIPPSRVPELWLMPAGGAPRSLGVVSAEKPMMMKVPGELMGAIAPRVMLALSLEPPGGSPTGLPTGPVVAEGMVTQL